jgi:cyclic-di-GMP phosphodiesterase, flagellum assembly factor TipF
MSVAAIVKPVISKLSSNKTTGYVNAMHQNSIAKAPIKDPYVAINDAATASARPLGFVAIRVLIAPFSIVIISCLLAIGVVVAAKTEFGFSLRDSSFLACACVAFGLGLAFFMHVVQRFKSLTKTLDHTRNQMAVSARILSETLDYTEKLSKQSPKSPSVQFASVPESGASKAHLQGLANIARAQVILANKSDTDIGVLSGLIRDLADIVAEQERELASLRGEASDARKIAQEAARVAGQIAVKQVVTSNAMQAPRITSGVVEPLPVDFAPPDRLLISKLETAFTDDGFATSFQPIVTLPQRKVKLYELSLMLKDDISARSGSMIRKAVFAAGLAINYDVALIQRSLQMIGHFRSRQKEIAILCEITGAVLVANPEFDQIISELRQQPSFAQSLTLGLSYESYSNLSGAEKDLLSFLSETGVKFALMGLTNMRLDPQALSVANVRFVTIDVVRLMDAVPTGLQGLDVHVADLAGLFARSKIELIVQNIASDRDLLDIIDMEIPLAQGKLLGEARPLNPAISDTKRAEPKPEPAPQSLAVASPPPMQVASQRQPLRNFLRRA